MNHDARLVRNLQGNSNNVCRVKNLFARFQNALCLLYMDVQTENKYLQVRVGQAPASQWRHHRWLAPLV